MLWRAGRQVEKLFQRYRRRAVLLHRPYPPHAGPPTNSKFGGLPNLPPHYDWPRTSEQSERFPRGMPLHFLAQIDCADLPFGGELPERGVLFFFGRDDEEQIWGDQSPADDCRVIHALDAFAATPPRPVPDDLPPIGGFYPRPGWSEFLRSGESGPNVHVEWPIQPLPMDSWPDGSGIPEVGELSERGWRAFLSGQSAARDGAEADALVEAYGERLSQKRAQAFIEATGGAGGPANDDDLQEHYERIRRAGASIFLGCEDETGGDWPHAWIYIHYAARFVRHRPERFSRNDFSSEEIAAAAEDWLTRSNAAQLADAVPEADKERFRAWVAGFRSVGEAWRLGTAGSELVVKACTATVRAWAGDRERAASIPPLIYDALEPEFSAWTVWGLQFSQMLGHAPSAQQARSADDPTVCLISLASEKALGWIFGDMGEASFWIAPSDLARRDFTKVWATVEGH